ncbi:MAG: hypothetical protein CHACPFDD_00942 [Phycisphaerae bacterium]|nr:hypothetical protein [Phycisphaerae bacterium]
MLRVIACVLIMLGAAAAAPATTYTFTATSGDWNSNDNWDPPGKPGSGDTAIIPNGKTCNIAAANQAVRILDVQSGGTLVIDYDNNLQLGENDASTTSTVDGEIHFIESAGDRAILRIWGTVTFDGSGEIGKRGSGYGGQIKRADPDKRAHVKAECVTEGRHGVTQRTSRPARRAVSGSDRARRKRSTSCYDESVPSSSPRLVRWFRAGRWVDRRSRRATASLS